MPYKDKQKRKEYLQKWREKHRWIRYQKHDAELGTTNFKSTICRKPNGRPDWKKEQQEIKKEKHKTMYAWRYRRYGNKRKYLRHKFLSTTINS